MDFEALLQRIEKLESQLKSVTKTLSNQHNQIGGLKDNSTQTVERFRDLKNDFILIKGSVGGPKKRLIIFSETIRNKKDKAAPEILQISQESKQ